MPIVKRATKGRGQRVYYDRSRRHNVRYYHVFGIARLVSAEGSCWRVLFFSWAFVFGFRGHK